MSGRYLFQTTCVFFHKETRIGEKNISSPPLVGDFIQVEEILYEVVSRTYEIGFGMFGATDRMNIELKSDDIG